MRQFTKFTAGSSLVAVGLGTDILGEHSISIFTTGNVIVEL